jgi:hypothetical protein
MRTSFFMVLTRWFYLDGLEFGRVVFVHHSPFNAPSYAPLWGTKSSANLKLFLLASYWLDNGMHNLDWHNQRACLSLLVQSASDS